MRGEELFVGNLGRNSMRRGISSDTGGTTYPQTSQFILDLAILRHQQIL